LENAATIRRHEIGVSDLRRFLERFGPFSLHPGETQCLLLCRQLGIPLLLADDLAAREAAQRQGVRPVGSLGVVVSALGHGDAGCWTASALRDETSDANPCEKRTSVGTPLPDSQNPAARARRC